MEAFGYQNLKNIKECVLAQNSPNLFVSIAKVEEEIRLSQADQC